MIALPVLLVFGAIALASSFAFPDHRHRKNLVGSVGLGVSIAMYASPLIVMVSYLFAPLKCLLLYFCLVKKRQNTKILILVIVEKGDTNKECGIHATTIIIVLILG